MLRQMSAAHRRSLLLSLSAAGFALVFAGFVLLERQGLGLGHFFYVPIVLAAVATGPRAGASAGVLATSLYVLAILVNPHIPSSLPIEQTGIRLVTYTLIGILVGVFASRNRSLLDELTQLAGRDQLTGLPNTRSFEAAIQRRLHLGEPFALLIGDVDELRRVNEEHREHGDDALRRLGDLLASTKGVDDDVARVGGDEFAVLTATDGADGRSLAVALERRLSFAGSSVTFGWATFPREGDNALSLYRAADERLYARKMARGFRRGEAQEPAVPVISA